MAAGPMSSPSEQRRTTTSADIAVCVREFNGSNDAHKDLWTRVHQAGDAVRRSVADRDAAQLRARQVRDFHLAVQAEYPHPRASLVQQLLIAAFTVGLDGVACWFAAQALGKRPDRDAAVGIAVPSRSGRRGCRARLLQRARRPRMAPVGYRSRGLCDRTGDPALPLPSDRGRGRGRRRARRCNAVYRRGGCIAGHTLCMYQTLG